ncbi:thioesterase II family protein [Actinoplanes sp. NPDC051494]|uniref:thioesterase II family protein n=1 Tax=Actinoplanes sp. NPDC051494 TaxID=3363907 RepID=UPI00379AB343
MTDDSRWLRRFQPAQPGAPRLVCFPHAGGSASYFLPVAQALAPQVEVFAVQYPGRQDRFTEPRVEDIATMAGRLHAVITRWGPGPLTLFGHSMGAIVAYEVARRLRRDRPDQELHLFASGRRAPHRTRSEPALHTLDDAGLITMTRALGGTATAVLDDPDMLRMILPALRSDYTAIETYHWEPDGAPPPCPVTALTGDSDPRTTPEEAAAWEQHSQHPFDLQVLPGGHFFLTDQAPAVLSLLRAHLGR